MGASSTVKRFFKMFIPGLSLRPLEQWNRFNPSGLYNMVLCNTVLLAAPGGAP